VAACRGRAYLAAGDGPEWEALVKFNRWTSIAALALVLPFVSPAAADLPDEVRFYHVDALGSVRAMTDANGEVVKRADYFPFGEELPCEFSSRQAAGYCEKQFEPFDPGLRFTGKERDDESDLDYFGARYYSGAVARFTSPDSPFADQTVSDPQSWNLYAYVRGNPGKYVDPTGRGAAKGAALGAVDFLVDMIPAVQLYRQADLLLHPGRFQESADETARLMGRHPVDAVVEAVQEMATTDEGQEALARVGTNTALQIGTVIAGARAKAIAETPPTAPTAEAAADAALAAGRTRGAASELRVGDRTFADVSTGGVPRKYNPKVQAALDSTPVDKRAPWHGGCAENGCLSQAFDAGIDPAGGRSRSVNIGESGKGHGTPKSACPSCQWVLRQFGVEYD
jgi:RHS repeat-associated protein